MDQHLLVMVALAGIASVAVILALFPNLFADSKAEQRQKVIQSRPSRNVVSDTARDPNSRRKQVADSLKDLEKRNKSKALTMEARLAQAGLEWSLKKFWLVSGLSGLGFGGAALILNGSTLIIVASFGIGAFGSPRWIIDFRRKKRIKKFREAFPEALDMITRGVKAGIPLGDCLRTVARESMEPVRTEFKHLVQSQGIGLSVGEATDRLAERIPMPETNFFCIVINIQQKAGGNLSEALGNLARVLRDRKKMEGKIKAMSAEAKASAGIIGALPFAVGTLVWLTSPEYMQLLWTTDTGRMVMLGSLFWMSIGIFVIKKMISFDF